MAFLEWRKFNFFDLETNVDGGKLNTLKDIQIKSYTSGNGYIILCGQNGSVHFISKSWKTHELKAYESSIDHALHLRQSSLLLTVGEDDPTSQCIVIKTYDTSVLDKNELPVCLKTKTIRRPGANVTVTSICANVSPTLMVLGMSDGTIWMRRGDFTRNRGVRTHTIKDSTVPITGLAIRNTAKQTFLFVATEDSVFMYNVTVKEKEYKVALDSIGCRAGCAILAETIHGSHFMIARDDAIYCYTSDGRGPCYAISGEKLLLESFRNYLVIISRDDTRQQLTVLDIQNKFIVFTSTLDECRAVLNEWGGFYLIDRTNRVCHLNEKDLQSKLSLLFKKNLYDVAIRIAKSQQYDADSLMDIFRQYGDYLYTKGDHVAAVGQYIKTIGRLEASYVIRKFLDSQYIDKLTMYLQALHKKGLATEDHTTLLLNCYTKLNHTDKLKEFILDQDRDVDFDIDIAIKVCRQVSVQDALVLAKKYAKHEWYLSILVDDFAEHDQALVYLTEMFEDGLRMRNDTDETRRIVLGHFRTYAHLFMQHAPNATTDFLKRVYKDYRDADLFDDDDESIAPDRFLPIFLNHPAKLVEFVECLLANGAFSRAVYDTLIENYLCVWSSGATTERDELSRKIVNVLQMSDFDKSQALILCRAYKFQPGVLFLYEDAKLYQQILQYLMKSDNNAGEALACCRKHGNHDPNLWLQALWFYTNRPATDVNPSDDQIIQEILDEIVKQHLLSPLLVLDALAATANTRLGLVRSFLTTTFAAETSTIARDYETIAENRDGIVRLREHIRKLRDEPTEFRALRCAVCHHPLELPAVHFMCQHSFHQHCFQSFSDNELDCPSCHPANQQLHDKIKLQQTTRDLHESFHMQLERADDTFALLSDYFGRGVFNKYTVVTGDDDLPAVVSVRAMIDVKVGVDDNRAKYGSTTNSPTRTITDGRMKDQRLVDKSYSKSYDPKPSYMTLKPARVSPRMSKSRSKDGGLNPFDDATPFDDDDDDVAKSLNPFDDDDDDDDGKNPFA